MHWAMRDYVSYKFCLIKLFILADKCPQEITDGPRN